MGLPGAGQWRFHRTAPILHLGLRQFMMLFDSEGIACLNRLPIS